MVDLLTLTPSRGGRPEVEITAAEPIKPKAIDLARMALQAALEAGVAAKDLIEAIAVQAEVSAPNQTQ